LELLFEDLNRIRPVKTTDLFKNIEEVHEDYNRAVKLWQVAAKIGKYNEVPYDLRYWL